MPIQVKVSVLAAQIRQKRAAFRILYESEAVPSSYGRKPWASMIVLKGMVRGSIYTFMRNAGATGTPLCPLPLYTGSPCAHITPTSPLSVHFSLNFLYIVSLPVNFRSQADFLLLTSSTEPRAHPTRHCKITCRSLHYTEACKIGGFANGEATPIGPLPLLRSTAPPP